MLIAGFDVETTGLNVKEDHIIQVACVLWDTKAAKKKAKLKYDAAILVPDMPLMTEEVIKIHGITDHDLQTYGRPPQQVYAEMNAIFGMADAILAHNGNLYDKPILEANCIRHKVKLHDLPWIDSTCDVQFPAHIQTRKLVHLAAEHGFVNPFPHDALSDVLTMLKIADQYDWDKILEWSKAPGCIVQADATYQQRELAKKQNFRWDNDNKKWIKSIKQFQLPEVQKAALDAGFKIIILKGK